MEFLLCVSLMSVTGLAVYVWHCHKYNGLRWEHSHRVDDLLRRCDETANTARRYAWTAGIILDRLEHELKTELKGDELKRFKANLEDLRQCLLTWEGGK